MNPQAAHSEVTVRRPDGTAVAILPILKGSLRRLMLMGDDYIMLKAVTAAPLELRLGDWCEVEGLGVFELAETSRPEYDTATGGYRYELRLEAEHIKWKNKICRYLPTVGGRETSFTLTASPKTHLELIAANVEALAYGVRQPRNILPFPGPWPGTADGKYPEGWGPLNTGASCSYTPDGSLAFRTPYITDESFRGGIAATGTPLEIPIGDTVRFRARITVTGEMGEEASVFLAVSNADWTSQATLHTITSAGEHLITGEWRNDRASSSLRPYIAADRFHGTVTVHCLGFYRADESRYRIANLIHNSGEWSGEKEGNVPEGWYHINAGVSCSYPGDGTLRFRSLWRGVTDGRRGGLGSRHTFTIPKGSTVRVIADYSTEGTGNNAGECVMAILFSTDYLVQVTEPSRATADGGHRASWAWTNNTDRTEFRVGVVTDWFDGTVTLEHLGVFRTGADVEWAPSAYEMEGVYRWRVPLHPGYLCGRRTEGMGGGGTGWRFIVHSGQLDVSAQTVTYDSISILDALTTVAKAFDAEWWREGNAIHLGRCEVDSQGNVVDVRRDDPGFTDYEDLTRGENVESVTSSATDEGHATRVIPFGGTQNISPRYRRELVFEATGHSAEGGRTYIWDETRRLSGSLFPASLRVYEEGAVPPASPGGGVTLDFDAGVPAYGEWVSAGRYTSACPVKGGLAPGRLAVNGGTFMLKARFLNSFGGGTVEARATLRVYTGAETLYSQSVCVQPTTSGGYMEARFIDSEAEVTAAASVIFAEATLEYKARDRTQRGRLSVSLTGQLRFSHSTGRYSVEPLTIVPIGDDGRDMAPVEGCVLNPSKSDSAAECNRLLLPSGQTLGPGRRFRIREILAHRVKSSYFTDRCCAYEGMEGIEKCGVVTRRLMLPEDYNLGRGYVELPGLERTEEAVEAVVTFDWIYPRAEMEALEVTTAGRGYDQENDDGTSTRMKYDAYILREGKVFTRVTPWSASRYLLEGVQPEIHFLAPATWDEADHEADPSRIVGQPKNPNGGRLNGLSFKVTPVAYGEETDTDGNTVSLVEWEVVRDDETGLPNAIFHPEPHDRFTITGIDIAAVDEVYTLHAERELAEAAEEYTDTLNSDATAYSCTMMPDTLRARMLAQDTSGSGHLRSPYPLGRLVNLVAPGLTRVAQRTEADGTVRTWGRRSRIIGMELALDIPYDRAVYTVGEKAAYSRFKAIEDRLDSFRYTMDTQAAVRAAAAGAAVAGGTSVSTSASQPLIRSDETSDATDSRAYSSLRTVADFCRKKFAETVEKVWEFAAGIRFGSSGRKIDGQGNATLGSVSAASVTSTGKVTASGDISTTSALTASGKATLGSVESRGPVKGTDGSFTGSLTVSNAIKGGTGTFKGCVTSESGFRSPDNITAPGLYGNGGGMWRDQNGEWHVDTHYITVKKKLTAMEVEVQQLSHVGGAVLISPAEGTLAEVTRNEETGNYVCYIDRRDFEGREVSCDFRAGDLVLCQTFNLRKRPDGTTGNRRYWRLVRYVAPTDDTDTRYQLVLSDQPGECETGSDAPEAGDRIVTLGNSSDPARRNAIILSSYGDGSPSIVQYSGINSFTLAGRDVTRISPYGNSFTGVFNVTVTDSQGQTSTRELTGWVTDGLEELEIGVDSLASDVDNRLKAVGNRFSRAEASIQANANSITMSVSQLKAADATLTDSVTGLQTRIQQEATTRSELAATVDGISATVSQHTSYLSDHYTRIVNAETAIKAMPGQIQSTVTSYSYSKSETDTRAASAANTAANSAEQKAKDYADSQDSKLDVKITQARSAITQTADAIRMEVSQSSGADNLLLPALRYLKSFTVNGGTASYDGVPDHHIKVVNAGASTSRQSYLVLRRMSAGSLYDRAPIEASKGEVITFSCIIRNPANAATLVGMEPFASAGRKLWVNLQFEVTLTDSTVKYYPNRVPLSSVAGEDELVCTSFTVPEDCRIAVAIQVCPQPEGLSTPTEWVMGCFMATKGAGYVPFTLEPAQLRSCGIDLENNTISLRAGQTYIWNEDGTKCVAMFDGETGAINAELINTDRLNVKRIDARSASGRGATVNETGDGSYCIYDFKPIGAEHKPRVIFGMATVQTRNAAGETVVVPVYVRGYDSNGVLQWWGRCDSGERETAYVQYSFETETLHRLTVQTQSSLPLTMTDQTKQELPEYASSAITAYNLLVGTAETDPSIKVLHGKWSSVGTNVAQFKTGLLSGLYTPGAVSTSVWKTKVESNGAIYKRQVSRRAVTVYSFSGGVRSTVATYTKILSQGSWIFVSQGEPLRPAEPPSDDVLRS